MAECDKQCSSDLPPAEGPKGIAPSKKQSAHSKSASHFTQVALACALLAVTFIVYWPAMHGEYLWDDNVMLTENRLVQQNNGLKDIWFSTEPHDYFPLTYTSFWLEWRCWKMNSFGYHATNVTLHALGAILLWRIFKRLKVSGAWLAALIFAVHPVCVPSVAWIAERKNTLSLVFYLGSLLFFLKDESSRRVSPSRLQVSRWYFLSLFAFLLALLSKTSVVMLPFVLLACVWWQRQRKGDISSEANTASHLTQASFNATSSDKKSTVSCVSFVGKNDFVRLVPFLLLALVLGLITIWFQKHRAIGGQTTDPLLTRLAGGGWAVWFYLSKALWPINLTMIYPRWSISPGSLLAWLPWLAWFGLLFTCWKFRRGWGRVALFALGYFFLTLAPVLGIFDMSFFAHSRAADHLQYLSVISIVALAVGTAVYISPKSGKAGTTNFAPGYFIVGALALVLAGLSWNRAHAFANSENLWRDNVKKNPRAWGAHNNLGLAVVNNGKADEALEHYRNALKAKPDYANAHNNLGLALADRKQHREAIAHYEAALKIEPKFAEVHNNIANSLAALDRLKEAISHYQIALQLKPDFTFAHNNFGFTLARLKRHDEAMAHYQIALQLRPDYDLVHHNYGLTLLELKKYPEAMARFREALRLNPALADAHYYLGNALSDSGKLDEAVAEYQMAIRLKPQSAEAHNSLGVTLAIKGNLTEASHFFAEAVRLQPTNAGALNNLAHALAQENRHAEAVQKYEALLQLTPEDAEAQFSCGVSWRRLGRIEKAAFHFREALRLKPDLAEAKTQLEQIDQK